MMTSSSETTTTDAVWPHGPTQFERRHGNARTRVVTGAVAIPIVLATVFIGGWAMAVLVALLSAGTLLEFYWLAEKKGATPDRWIGVGAGLLLNAAFFHGRIDAWIATSVLPPAIAFDPLAAALVRAALVTFIFVLLTATTLVAQLRSSGGSPLLNMATTIAGVGYVSLFFSTLLGLREFPHLEAIAAAAPSADDTVGMLLVIGILVSIWTCDSAAYYAGRAFGRHKLFERVSPKKTWEGAVAGAITAVVVFVGLRIAFAHQMAAFVDIGDAVVIGLIIGVFGQVGDLAESHLKRDAGVKDSSALIPGHGGLLDRFDSLLFVAPLVYCFLLSRILF